MSLHEAERMVLGAMMLHRSVIAEISETLSGADFHQPRHEAIFDAIQRLDGEGKPADAITVADALGDDLTRAGGPAYLFELTGLVPTASNGPYYADIVRAAAIRRQVTTIGQTIASLTDSDDPLEAVESARNALETLAIRETGDSNPEDDLDEAIADLENGTAGTPTPWRDLNDVIAGWKPGCLYYVGARPATGKSVIGVGALLDMAFRGQHAAMFSLEMSKVEVYHRMLASVGSIDAGHIQHRRLSNDDWDKVAKARGKLTGLPVTIDERANLRVAQIRAKCRTLQRRGNLGLVVVDYLQLMSGKGESRQQVVSELSRSMKLLAKELQVPVVVLSQLNRKSEYSADKRPTMSELRESGSLEQDGDVVMLLHRDVDKAPDVLEVMVAKNRHGPADRIVRLAWEGHHSRATDYRSTWTPADITRSA